MTPEEAKPHKFKMSVIGGRTVMDNEHWFTAKETAEIAKAYGMACLHSYMDKDADTAQRFENLFEEWSK